MRQPPNRTTCSSFFDSLGTLTHRAQDVSYLALVRMPIFVSPEIALRAGAKFLGDINKLFRNVFTDCRAAHWMASVQTKGDGLTAAVRRAIGLLTCTSSRALHNRMRGQSASATFDDDAHERIAAAGNP